VPEGDNNVLEAKKTNFSSRYGMFLGELSTCPQNPIPARGVEPREKHHTAQGSMPKFLYKGHFWTIKNAYGKFPY
jgi:hypothetical protein